MEAGLRVFHSNRLESLLETFQETLFHPSSHPFCQRIVIVPHTTMKSWLQQRLASSFSAGIATGMEIQTEDIALSRLVKQLCVSQEGLVPWRLELSLAIEAIIHTIVADFPTMEPAEQQVWQPLIGLLGGLSNHTQQRRRIILLSEELAGLFESYGKHGSRVVEAWTHNTHPRWQERLWLLLHEKHRDWCTWAHFLNADIDISKQLFPTVALFGVSYLPPLHHRFLEKISALTTVNYFTLSACQHYWSDIRSDHEVTRLRRSLQESGVRQSQQLAMQDFLQDTNPLLANLGKLGRTMTCQLEDLNAEVESFYYLPHTVTDHAAYTQCMTDETILVQEDAQLTLLQAVQADMLLLRNPRHHSPLQLPADDSSLQLHISVSRVREVEALYHTLLQIIDKHSLAPADIAVMAPDIEEYRSAITAVFGSVDSQIPYQIVETSMASDNAFAQAFLDLLALSQGRWDASAVMQLMSNPYLAQKYRFTAEELEKIRKWIDDARIIWGRDAQHRNDILLRSHCRHGMASDGYIGTWDHGTSKLLHGLVTGENSKLTFSEAELFSRWLAFIDSLWADLHPLMNDVSMTISDWATYLECLCDGYLMTTDRRSEADRDAIYQLIHKIGRTSRSLPDEKFSYSSIAARLESSFNAAPAAKLENNLQTVRFGSMQTLRGQPHAVIALLGLDEASYPRLQRRKALDIVSHHVDADPVPTSMDVDRYLFLEAILSARQSLIMSYCAICPEDGKEQYASTVISEIINYLDSHYRLGDQSAAVTITVNHPFYPFDDSYFSGRGKAISYSQHHYKAALALQGDRSLSNWFLSGSDTPIEPQPKHLTIDVTDLSGAAKNPLKLYLNKSLGLYLKDIDQFAIVTEEPFVLSALDKYEVTRDILTSPIHEVLSKHLEQGCLPLGTLGSVANHELLQLAEEQAAAWNTFQTHQKQIFHIELSINCAKPLQLTESLWRLPAPSLTLANGEAVQIVGKLTNITPKGLLSTGKQTDKYLIRSWPSLLLLNHLKPMIEETCHMEIEPKLLFLKTANTSKALDSDSSEALARFTQYALESQQTPSLLVDEWVPLFLEKNPDEITKKIAESLNKEDFFNEEAKWLLANYWDHFELDAITEWKRKAQEVYSDVLSNLKAGKR